mgnify:CR=1 FL=1
MTKAGDLVIDELGNIGILMHNGYIWLLVDPTYDCLECMGAVNDLHPANLFRFPIPEDMTYEDEPIKFEICLK